MKLLNILIITALSCSFFAEAKPSVSSKNLNYRPLISKVQQIIKARKFKAQNETQLLKFTISPNEPKVQEDLTLFIQPLTGFTDSEIILEVFFDSVNKTSLLEKPATELWVLDLGKFSEIKQHNVFVNIFLRDKNSAQLIIDAIKVLDTAIADLNEQIDTETDPEVIVELTEQRDDKMAQKDELTTTLDTLNTKIGDEAYNFNVNADTSLTNYPKITSVNPNVVKAAGGTDVVITGLNFGNSPALKIDGNTQSITGITSTSISFTSPVLAQGPHNIEISTVISGDIKNVISKNAIFSTSSDLGNPNLPPTAVISVVDSSIDLGTVAEFSAENSFDSNEKPIRYEWRMVTVPDGSSISAGNTVVATTEDYSFTSNVPGTYVLELKVIQTGGLQLASSAVHTVLQVAAPTNRAPTATAANITVLTSQEQTSQIYVTDLDFWQKHSYFISKQGAKGTATVSGSGLITYAAGGTTGSDAISVMIVDNANPALSAVVDVNITISSSNISPNTGTPIAVIRSEGLPVLVSLVANTANDPDGTITKIQFNAGDGTTEYAPVVAGANFGIAPHNYQAFGTYNASVTVTDNLGATTTTNFTVNVVDTDLPTAKFSVNTYSCSAPCTITANASAAVDSVGITQYRWLWGDNTAEEVGSGFVTRSHTYNSNGTYRIRLRTRDANIAQGEGFATVYVGVTAPGTGSPSNSDFINYPYRQVQIGYNLTFEGERSFDPNPSGSITNYAWNFGPSTGSGETASFSYLFPNNYFPFLTTTNALGGTSASTRGEVMIVTTSGGQAPRALFSVNGVLAPLTVSGVAPFAASVNSNISYDYDGTIVSRSWNFGDNTTATTESAVKVYSTPGVYFLNLQVTDDDGNSNTKAHMVVVNSAKRLQNKSVKTASDDIDDNKQNLTSACGMGNGEACFYLAQIYEAEGNAFVAEKLMERACGLAYAPACGKR